VFDFGRAIVPPAIKNGERAGRPSGTSRLNHFQFNPEPEFGSAIHGDAFKQKLREPE
jgi:hypothetical protein